LLNHAGAQEGLDGDSAIDVGVVESARGELSQNFGRGSRHLFDLGSAKAGEIERPSAENDDLLFAIGPLRKRQNRFKRLAADDNDSHGCNEFAVTVGFATACREKVQLAVGAGDEAVDTGSYEDGAFDHERCLSWL